MGNNRFLKGAMILSISMFATKFLGILYVIPFQRLVKETGMALYNYAYVPYALFISLSTLGIPVGMAKFISRYNAAGEYDTSRKIFKYSMFFMSGLGIIGFLTLYFLAPWYAALVLGGEDAVNSIEDVTMAIQMVSFALIIIPPMAIFRGFFQGNKDMVPTSISQFVEQLVRIIFILVGSYYILRVSDGTKAEAVAFSVFSAFLAGVMAFVILYYYWRRNLNHYNQLLKETTPHKPHHFGNLFSELISYAIPFAILGLTTNLFQMIDNSTFNHLMIHGYGEVPTRSEQLFGMLAFLNKIIMIPVSFAIAFGQPLIPELTHYLTEGNAKEVRKVLMLAIQLTCFITVPAVVGMTILAHPIYILFFTSTTPELNVLGGNMFQLGSSLGLFMALYSIITAILQGIGGQWYGIVFMVISLLIKYIGNVVLIPILGLNGSLIATMSAYAFCIVMSLGVVKRKTRIRIPLLLRRVISIFVFSGIMALVVMAVRMVLNLFMTYNDSYVHTLIYVGVTGIAGVMTYFGLAWYFDLLGSLFGVKITINSLRRRLFKR